MSVQASTTHAPAPPGLPRWLRQLNGPYHEVANKLFMLIVFAHLAEHLVQAFQIFVLGMPRPESRGILGQVWPWLVSSEALHYGYALVMLAGLFLLLPGFQGKARTWWIIALVIQFWHHIEHALLQGQAIMGQNLFGSPVPISIAQIWVPRVELHLFYNTIVLVPMLIAMYYHLFPPAKDAAKMVCSCAIRVRA